ncbi:uncharacterized protein BDW47DRAFT_47665 [Aspergillus candidus]|uniref:DUF7707 domain-containing protein n=1 Tax=Aspergillus candidus TaxID=41067 RepID=A0A2I2F7T0_ASPCN|nr:hypothetical protein BDW47DRAFT_47665 [Aspergillus candidus]PLB36681.1 hypothetical protein BDW47DRAFT_47665 [Aspergillus candidus]
MLPILLLSSFLATTVVAGSEYSLPEGFDLNQIKSTDRAAWCRGQRNTCPKMCDGAANDNSCDTETLKFTCTCEDGSSANSTDYMQTVPYYVCEANFGQCISRSPDLDDQEKCKTAKEQCGSRNASETSTTSSSSASPSPTGTSTDKEESDAGTTTGSSSSTPSPTSNAAVRLMQDHASGVLATVLFVGLRVFL